MHKLLLLIWCIPLMAISEPQPFSSQLETIKALARTNIQEGLSQVNQLQSSASVSPLQLRKLIALKIIILEDLGKREQAYELANMLLESSRAAGDLEGQTNALEYMAIYTRDNAEHIIAQTHINEAERLAEQAGDSSLIRRVYMTKGSLYDSKEQTDEALRYYFSALALAEGDSFDERRDKTKILNNIAITLMKRGEMGEAEGFYNRSLNAAKLNKDIATQATIDINLGIIAVGKGQFNIAEKRFLNAFDIAQSVGMANTQAVAMINLADLAYQTEVYTKCISYALQAIATASQSGQRLMESTARANLGVCYLRQGDVEQGLVEMALAIDYMESSNEPYYLNMLQKDFAQTLAAIGLFEQAFDVQLTLTERIEQQQISAREAKIAELRSRFEAEEKRRQIELLEAQNRQSAALVENQKLQKQISMLVVATVVLLLVVIATAYHRILIRNKKLLDTNATLKEVSMQDALTGLMNRRAFSDTMEKRQDAEKPLTGLIALMDVDHFKQINDTYGHHIGDDVLQVVAKRLQNIARERDLVVRWGGEEFLIWMTNANSERSQQVIERYLRKINAQPIHLGTHTIPVTMSAGFVELPFKNGGQVIDDIEDALILADAALYASKLRGRNQAHGVMSIERDVAGIVRDYQSDMQQAILDEKLVLTPTIIA